jgi:hypothetical protein
MTRRERELMRDLTNSLYDAVRTNWELAANHYDEDRLIGRAEKLLGVKFPWFKRKAKKS